MNNVKTFTIAASLVAAFASSAAFADTDEYTRNLNMPAAPTAGASRAEVRSATVQAKQAGTIATNEYERNQYPKAIVPTTLQRAQVVAEAIEARKLGLISEGEGVAPTPTAAQIEQIRLAGQAAVQHNVATK